jgi:ribosomal protein L40E
MYCNKCGATVEVDDKFCRTCGTSTYSIKKIGEQNPWTASTPLPPPPKTEKKTNTPIIEKRDDNKFLSFIKLWAYRIIVLVAASMAIVIAKPIGQLLTDKYQESKFWEEAPKKFEEEKKSMGLPKRIDEFTTVSDIFIVGREIHYDYIINDLELNEATKHEADKVALDSFNKALCKNAMITKLGGISVYTYKFHNGDATYRFTKSNCKE